jgi:hypothetical protein
MPEEGNFFSDSIFKMRDAFPQAPWLASLQVWLQECRYLCIAQSIIEEKKAFTTVDLDQSWHTIRLNHSPGACDRDRGRQTQAPSTGRRKDKGGDPCSPHLLWQDYVSFACWDAVKSQWTGVKWANTFQHLWSVRYPASHLGNATDYKLYFIGFHPHFLKGLLNEYSSGEL